MNTSQPETTQTQAAARNLNDILDQFNDATSLEQFISKLETSRPDIIKQLNTITTSWIDEAHGKTGSAGGTGSAGSASQNYGAQSSNDKYAVARFLQLIYKGRNTQKGSSPSGSQTTQHGGSR